MAPSHGRSVNCYGHGYLVSKFPINVTVPRDELRMAFATLLPVELIKQIAGHLTAMREFDQEIAALNRRRPDDRSARPLHCALPEFARELKIPNMERPGTFLWPPPDT